MAVGGMGCLQEVALGMGARGLSTAPELRC